MSVTLVPDARRKMGGSQSDAILSLRCRDDPIQLAKDSYREFQKDSKTKYRHKFLYTYMRILGSSIGKICGHRQVDPNRTASINMKDMCEYLGIDSVRRFIVTCITDDMRKSGFTLGPSYVSLMVSYMTQQGFVIALDYTGMKKSNVDFITLSCVERPGDAYMAASITGRMASADSIPVAVGAGVYPKVGSTMGNVQQVLVTE